MNRWKLLQLILMGPAFAAATFLVGWLGVPLLACFWGWYDRIENRPALVGSVSAGIGWLIMLLWTSVNGPVLLLAQRTAAIWQVPTIAFLALTILFPMGLAWSAGIVGMTLRHGLSARAGSN